MAKIRVVFLDLQNQIASGGGNGPEWFKDRGIFIVRKTGTAISEALPSEETVAWTKDELGRFLESKDPSVIEDEILIVTDSSEILELAQTLQVPPGLNATIEHIISSINFIESEGMPREL